MENTLYYGDNLEILREYIKDETIDLIYLDPPFNSKQSYNILFAEKNGTQSPAQIKAFEDTWHWDKKAEETYREIVENLPKKVADLIRAFRSFLGENDMMAYLVMMAIRLQELHRVLKPTGSIYLHCDPTASHYLKLVMDAVFGVKNVKNEIIWHYRRWTAPANRFQKLHDIIFFYTKGNNYVFNQQLTQYTNGSIERKKQGILHRFKAGEVPFLVSNKEIQKEGVPENDVWHIPFIAPSARERLGYPTQKPEKLLERMIKASSNEDDLVLDPFCGCGTTIAVAEKLKRKWIGIDITHLAVSLMKHRIENTFGNRVNYKVIGEPTDLKGAEELARQDPYQFQWWALGLVGARPAESEKKKGADKGIDGCIYFHDEPKMVKTKAIIIQVKCGHINRGMIDALKGVVGREGAQIGVFITLQKPTKPMRKEALSSGFYKSPSGKDYPKIQILTIKDLINGNKNIERPPKVASNDVTFKKAKGYTYNKVKQRKLL
ncbi:hypothetical protein ES705_21690 [subsurface metagenome]